MGKVYRVHEMDHFIERGRRVSDGARGGMRLLWASG